MPKSHGPEHMAMLSKESASKRRAAQLARRIRAAPPIATAQAAQLHQLLEEHTGSPAEVSS